MSATESINGVTFSEWIEIPRAFLEWRAGIRRERPSKQNGAFGPKEEYPLNQYGVYLLSEFVQRPDPPDVSLAEHPIIYVGKAALQSFHQRWTNTHAAWVKLGERYKTSSTELKWFFSLATVQRKAIRTRVWSEEVLIGIDAIYIEYLEKGVRDVLRQRNSYYRERKIGD